MYKIKVLKKGKVILGDINLTLTHNQVIDLDAMLPRTQTESSYNLNCAINGDSPAIAVLHKDVYRGIHPDAFKAMEDRIRNSLIAQIPQVQPTPQPKSEPVVPAQSPNIEAKLEAILDALKNSGQQRVAESSPDYHDDETSVDIHTRTLQRLTKNSTGHVGSDNQVKDSDAAKRAKELDDFDF
jgi:hypothetical protein